MIKKLFVACVFIIFTSIFMKKDIYDIFEFIKNAVCVYLAVVAFLFIILVFCMHRDKPHHKHTTQIYNDDVNKKHVNLKDYIKKCKKDVKPFLKDVDVKF